VILCRASDRDAPAWPPPQYFADFIGGHHAGGLYDYWLDVSYGQLDLQGSTVLGWYQLSQTAAEIAQMDRGTLVSAARAVAGAAAAGFAHTLAVATEYPGGGNVGSDVAAGIFETLGQPGWRWCSKCESLAFWDGSRDPGACVAGGRHDHGGSSYYAVRETGFVGGQPGWRWCVKCETMVFNTSNPATCPGGGTHDLSQSGPYVLHLGGATDREQDQWHWCSKCQGLAFWDRSRAPGPCPMGGLHDHSTSGDYGIAFAWAADVGWFAHESGHGFGLDHSFDLSRTGDLYNDSRPGAYGDRADIMSWANTAFFAAPRFTPAGAGLNAPILHKLGWLGSDVAQTVDVFDVQAGSAPQSVALSSLYDPGPRLVTHPRMIRVVRPSEGRIYTAEFRSPADNWDRGLVTAPVVVHLLPTLYAAGQDQWRHCSSCEGLVYAGQTACPAGGVHDGGSSGDYGLLENVGPSGGQTGWRWCRKCSGLVFPGQGGTLPSCPAGGSHDLSSSGDYAIPMAGPGQAGWRRCQKCGGLGFSGNPTPGVCPAGSLHDYSASGNYVLSEGSGNNRQNGWRWCNKCQGLYFAGLGACKGGSVHDFSGSSDYSLVHDLAGAIGQPGWRWCAKCYALAFNDGTRLPGLCAAGGRHDHSASGHYVLPTDAETANAQLSWHWCSKCSALNYHDGTRNPGPCSAGGVHDPKSAYLIAHDTSAVPGQQGFAWCSKCECMVSGKKPAPCSAGGNHDTSASAAYVIRTDPAQRVREQAFWRTCTKCSEVMALTDYDATKQLPCPAGGTHAPQGEYFLTQQTSDPFWRWCSKCEAMAYWDGSRAPGPCPASGEHDHTKSGFYAPPQFLGEVTEVVASDLQPGQTYVNDIGTVTFEVDSHVGGLVTVTSK
jgi:hypothetical protein